MTSSISSSDAETAPSGWRVWLAMFALAPVIFAMVCGVTILLDPFSTGRFTPLGRIDIATRDTLYGHAARVRDPMFNAAIIGNSHGLPFNPVRLTAATGQRFTQLSSLGLNPSEQLTIARAFLRNHRHQPVTLLMVLDQSWCEPLQAHNRIKGFFPAFLFETSSLGYFRNIISPRAVNAAAYRFAMTMGFAGDRQRRDGYDPITFPNEWSARQLAEFASWSRPTQGVAPDAPLPTLDELRTLASEFESELRMILFFTPVPRFSVPVPGSPAAERLNACKARYRDVTRTRPRSAFVDRMVDDAFTQDMRNFGDITHIHVRSAPIMEQVLIPAIRATLAN